MLFGQLPRCLLRCLLGRSTALVLLQALEVFLAGEPDEDCLGICLYATAPAFKHHTTTTNELLSSAAAAANAATGPLAITAGAVVLTADIQISVYDHELEQWGLMYRQNLPVRTGFGANGVVRYAHGMPGQLVMLLTIDVHLSMAKSNICTVLHSAEAHATCGSPLSRRLTS